MYWCYEGECFPENAESLGYLESPRYFKKL